RLFFIFTALIVVHVLATTAFLSAGAAGNTSDTQQLWPLWVLGGASITVGVVITWFLLRKMLQPLAELSKHVRSFSDAKFDFSPALGDHDELGALVGAFDRMQRDLADRRDQIEDHAERLQTVLSSMAEGVLAVGPDKSILLANDAAR